MTAGDGANNGGSDNDSVAQGQPDVDDELGWSVPDRPSSGVLGHARRRTLKEGEVPSTVVDCPHASTCSGCELIDFDYVDQLHRKRALVVKAMGRYKALAYAFTSEVEPADPIVGYRTRVRLHAAPGALGYPPRQDPRPSEEADPQRSERAPMSRGPRDRRSRPQHPQVVNTPECRVLTPALRAVANALRDQLASPACPAELKPLLTPPGVGGAGALRAVELRHVWREGQGAAVLLTLVMPRDRSAELEVLKAGAKKLLEMLPHCIGIAAKLFDTDGKSGEGVVEVLAGEAHGDDDVGGARHLTTYTSHTLVHREQATRLFNIVIREVGSIELEPHVEGEQAASPTSARPRVLNLFGGSGALAIALAQANNDVVMVDASAELTRLATVAAHAHGLTQLSVRQGHVDEALAALTKETEGFEAIVVTPPKRGVPPSAREAMTRLGASVIVYVAGNADTLARDLDHFARLGYVTAELFPMDVTPLTGDVETIAVLRRGPTALPQVVFENNELLVVEKEPHEPVEPHSEYPSCLLRRAQRLPGMEQLYPIHQMEPGTSGVCMFARTAEAAERWQTAFTASAKTVFLVGVRGATTGKGAINRELRERGQAVQARSRYRRLALTGGHSIVRVLPDNQGTHQVRRHFAAIGHPVLGDARYGHEPTNRYFEDRLALDRNFMHLVRVELESPEGENVLFEAPLRGDLRAIIEQLGGEDALGALAAKKALGEGRSRGPSTDGSPMSEPAPMSSDEPVSSALPSSRFTIDASGPAPDLDESPRTLRQRITDDDEPPGPTPGGSAEPRPDPFDTASSERGPSDKGPSDKGPFDAAPTNRGKDGQ